MKKEDGKMNFKKLISLALVIVLLTLSLASCDIQQIIQSIKGTTTTTTGNEDINDPSNDKWEYLYDIITIKEALEIAQGATVATDTIYYVRGTVVTITSPDYGAMIINDGTGEISVYNTKGEDKSTYFPNLEDKPVKGDEVLLLCSLQNYNDTLEINQAYLIDFVKGETPDDSNYTEMTVAEARDATVGTKIKLTGVVARITYANGLKPSGVYLVDETNSIYIYDRDIAGQVSIGNKITVIGSKAMWILDKEQSNAQKFGYNGCCQIESATLVNNDKSSNTISFDWCEEKSVKEILEIPVTENVTTTVYKTTALVKKVPGNGFVNYYFFDLDGKTGAYTYTQCNGSDFSWLDAFDGKICTVYLSPMNAKSTSSDCYFRFLPVAVVDEGFEFDLAKTPEHVVKYYGVDQFISLYTGNPLLEVVTSVSSELLGFENATLSYASSNESVVYFEEVDGKLIFNCGENGTATITITGSYGDYEVYSKTLEITVLDPEKIEHISVSEAIGTEVGTKVTVRGIVGPSLANQSGFYIIDAKGSIPVRIDADAFAGLAIGQDVFVEGTVSITKDGKGQLCIDNASIIANLYGKNDYSTDSFIKDATMADIKALSDGVEITTSVYVVTAKITRSVTSYSTNYYVDGFMLYSGSPSQYAWLGELFEEGKDEATLTIELAICDWNGKGLKGCILAVITEDGKIYNEYNFK